MGKSKESAEHVEDVVGRIQADINLGVYKFGEQLKLSSLEQTYSTTRFYVRQALLVLKSLGLVEHQHNSGFRVCAQEQYSQTQLRFVRMTLERSAVPFVIANATAEDIVELRRLAAAFQSAAATSSRAQQTTANADFHRAVYRIARNPVLSRLIDGLRLQSYVGTPGRWGTREGLAASAAEHFAMVDAVEQRDPYELDRTIFNHIQAF
ncbi:GntR family transcriptional regulator [Rhodoplanes roseus]|uniref:HTH gntR-type domain-containing protein n=1 Tax=Rhodoplanes roseus TaxID=29409 RepID=A0A327L0K7_9BRAD|nr:GntR family transcriptional regulator [Rhodoplanes roseus]RAI43042.1 hypothetical protein CH341_16410 [Rhodoplanes roseus]